MMRFRTHTGELIEGEQLRAALNAVADWYEANARAIRREDCYASHVTETRKDELLNKGLEFAASVRRGEQLGFSVWQRLNAHITGECVAFLPKETT